MKPEQEMPKLTLINAIKPWLLFTILFLIAFAIKFLVLIEFNKSLFANLLILDMEDYDKWAMAIAQGSLIGKSAFNGLPFYPYFLGLMYFLFGHSLFAIRFFQIILGSLSCLLVFNIAKRLFNPIIGLIAFFFMLLFKQFYCHEVMLLPTTFAIFFYLVITSLLLSFFEKPNLNKVVWLGILTGLSSLNRAYALFLIPVVAVAIWFHLKKDSNKKISCCITYIGITLLVISSATLHNYMASKDFVPITAHGGVNLYIGNNPASDGTSVRVPFVVGTGSKDLIRGMKVMAEKEMARPLKPSEISRFWTSKAFDFINKNPGFFIRSLANKIKLFFCGFDISDMISYRMMSEHIPLLNVFVLNFRWMIPFALVGLGLTLSRRKEYIFVYLVLLGHIASLMLFLVVGRYRLSLAPFFIIFCSAFFAYSWDFLKTRNIKKCLIIFLAVIGLFLYLNNRGFNKKYNLNLGANYTYIGSHFLSEKEYQKAVKFFKKAVALEPHRAEAYNMLGLGYFYTKEYKNAVKQYRAALSKNKNLYQANNNLAVLFEKLSKRKEAIHEYQRSLKVNPSQPHIKKRIIELKSVTKGEE